MNAFPTIYIINVIFCSTSCVGTEWTAGKEQHSIIFKQAKNIPGTLARPHPQEYAQF